MTVATDHVLNGIQESKLQELSVEILDYRDKISELFNKLDSCIEKLPNSYRGKPSVKIIEKYEQIKLSCPTIKASLKNYADDLSFLIQKMHENDQFISTIALEQAVQVRSKIPIATFESENKLN